MDEEKDKNWKETPLMTPEQTQEFMKQFPDEEEKKIINDVLEEMKKQPLSGYKKCPFWSLGPCMKCGIKGYPLSMGGTAICPACDCGRLGRQLTDEQMKREFQACWELHLESMNHDLEKALLFAIRFTRSNQTVEVK